MNSILGIPKERLAAQGGQLTAAEIAQQPALWQEIAEQVAQKSSSIGSFFDKVSHADRVVLTGAGTSHFIGLSLKKAFRDLTGKTTEAIPTTDIVTHPSHFYQKNETLLLVSFARSGNSPESVAAVELADALCGQCHHLIITCNGNGELASFQAKHEKYVFLLPEKANDRSLAMTGSYSGMLLAALLMTRLRSEKTSAIQVGLLCQYAENFFKYHAPVLNGIAETSFERAVFLGSGPLLGTATECHLKLQELTDGKVICHFDSYLGFRHGPKAVVDETTLMVYFMSNDAYVRRYELDLLDSMRQGRPPQAQLVVSETPIGAVPDGSFAMPFSSNGLSMEEAFLPVCFVLTGQLLGFYKSLHLGLSPDNPSSSGAISRVVQGVSVYPFSSGVDRS